MIRLKEKDAIVQKKATNILFTIFSGKLSAMILDDLSKTTRKSLSKRRTNSKQMFFETMGDESTLGVSALIESAEISQSEVRKG